MTHVDVAIVGAGMAGMYAAHRFAELGVTLQGFEAGSSVGGVWFHNRYPGARVDVESLSYSYFFSRDLYREWTWSERLAAQPEILAYLDHVADRFGIRERFRFDTRVTSATSSACMRRWPLRRNARRRRITAEAWSACS